MRAARRCPRWPAAPLPSRWVVCLLGDCLPGQWNAAGTFDVQHSLCRAGSLGCYINCVGRLPIM